MQKQQKVNYQEETYTGNAESLPEENLTSIIPDRTNVKANKQKEHGDVCVAQTTLQEVLVCVWNVPPRIMCLNILLPASGIVEPSWGGAQLAGILGDTSWKVSLPITGARRNCCFVGRHKATKKLTARSQQHTPESLLPLCPPHKKTETSWDYEPEYIFPLISCFFHCRSIRKRKQHTNVTCSKSKY